MATGTLPPGGLYIPRYTMGYQSSQRPMHIASVKPMMIPRIVDPFEARSTPKAATSSANEAIDSITGVKIFLMAFLGAAIGMIIALPLTNVLLNPSNNNAMGSTTVITTTSTLALMNATTVTTTTSTISSTSTTSITTSSTTTSVTTTTTTATTTRGPCVSPCRCGGVMPCAAWQVYSSDTIYMNVNTSSCSFTRTPIYYTSIFGWSSHWWTIGFSAIYVPTNNSFTVYLTGATTIPSNILMNYSLGYVWDLQWVGMFN